MKELSERPKITQTTDPPSRNRTIAKCWKQVKDGTHPNKLKEQIWSKMTSYQLVLQKVKERYQMVGEIYFERDYTHDNSNPFIIYSFITPTFYWYIECTLNHEINIRYDFNGCIYEPEIRELFRQYSLIRHITHTPMDLQKHLQTVIAYQEPIYVHTNTG